MTTHPRARRPFWGDIRFLIGLVLVILSIAGVWLIVSSARETTPVLQANRTITQGEALASGDFHVVEVSLGTVVDDYLAPQDLEPGMIAARTVADGELLAATATGDADSGRTTNIVVESSVGIPARVEAGTPVELWYSPPLQEDGEYDAPRILAADVVVASIPESDGVLAERSAAVELVIARADVADVLAAINAGAALSIVPLGSGS
ncbi:SAF domain-containing protein [Microbacterium sp. NPDC077644]|uniref:SAF domain-containing protein n=1 Tax=Microbacterium sp. NPDC077644 TaxID=3155055 RepID=UPI00344C9EB2